MRWDAPAGASQYCLDTGNEDVGAAPQCPIHCALGAWIGSPPGRNVLRPYILGDAALFSGDEASCSLP